MAAIGFALIDILNQDPRFHINMSPFFVAFVAFCFSMTVGVVWEFFEFGMDQIFGMDMQKGFYRECNTFRQRLIRTDLTARSA